MKLQWAGLALVLSLSSVSSARAAGPCGGVEFAAGKIVPAEPFNEASTTSPAGKECLAHIGKEVQGRRLIRSVTVAVRVPDAQRTDGKALALARQIADALVAAGIPRTRVFALAPRTESTEPLNIQIGYTERSPENIVAQLATVDGDVRVGENEATLRPAEPGAPVLGNELITTGKGSSVVIRLKDGSGVKLLADGALKLLQLEVSATLERQVKLEVIKGEIDTEVRKAGGNSRFEASTRNAVASVRGTAFRLKVVEGGQSQLETTEGSVALAPKIDGVVGKAVEVPAGKGAAVDVKGTLIPPRPLLPATRVLAPLKGAFPADSTLRWEPATGAAGYQVELARDADFTMQREVITAPLPATVLSTKPAPGKWFWRVSPVDAGGFVGASSKVYAFTVVP